MLASLAALAQPAAVPGQRQPAGAQNIYRLTALDSEGWGRNYARKQYVVLSEAPVAAHKVQRWGSVTEGAQQLPLTMDLYSLLVPAATARRLVPALARQADWPLVAGDTLLITFSLLPTLEEGPQWQPVQPDTLAAGRRLPWAAVVGDGVRRLASRDVANRRHDHILFTRANLVPVVQRQGQYWAPASFVLTQYFLVRPRRPSKSGSYQEDFATINVKSPTDWYSNAGPTDGIERERTADGVAYFWSRPFVWMPHAGEMMFYGLHRFAYKPGIGVFSGDYRGSNAVELMVREWIKGYDKLLFYNKIRYTRALIDDKIAVKE